MSDSVFPSLRGADVAVEREPFYRTSVYETVSGKEQRVSWDASPRYRYRVRFNVLRDDRAAPAPWAAYSEVGTVLKFLDDHKGSFDSFLFNDPLTGSQVRVRLEEDSLTIKRIVNHLWSAEVSFVSVK